MAILTIKVDDNVLNDAKRVFDELGLDTNTAVNIFFKKCISTNSIPFDLKISTDINLAKTIEIDNKNILSKSIKSTFNDEDIEELMYEGMDV